MAIPQLEWVSEREREWMKDKMQLQKHSKTVVSADWEGDWGRWGRIESDKNKMCTFGDLIDLFDYHIGSFPEQKTTTTKKTQTQESNEQMLILVMAEIFMSPQ